MPERLLILGGTAEAAALARSAVERWSDRLEVTTSLAGRLPPSQDLPGRVRVGGFGGAEGLATYLRNERIDHVIDATHPFAATIARHAADACAAVGVPRLMLLRPPWARQPGDRWIEVPDFAAAAQLLPRLASRVFLAIGPGEVAAFAWIKTVWFLVRVFAPPPAPLPLPHHAVVVARPPFSLDSEAALLRTHRIAAIVSKQSGGPLDAKLAAARSLALPVVMIERPPKPAGERVETVEAALAWLAAMTEAAPSDRTTTRR